MPRFLVAILSAASLIAGGLVYISWRPISLHLFKWLGLVGLADAVTLVRYVLGGVDVPQWLLWSAPAGLWAFSGALAMRTVWWGNWSGQAWCWFVAIPAAGVVSELGQLAGMPGTFDVTDLAAYAIGSLLAVLVALSMEKT